MRIGRIVISGQLWLSEEIKPIIYKIFPDGYKKKPAVFIIHKEDCELTGISEMFDDVELLENEKPPQYHFRIQEYADKTLAIVDMKRA